MQENKIIDVSVHNGDIDFKQVKQYGVAGVIHRATLGGGNDVDKNYKTNAQKILAAGLYIGAYHVITEASIEDQINNIKTNVPINGKYPPLTLSLQDKYKYEASFISSLVIKVLGLIGRQPTIHGNFNKLQDVFGNLTPNDYIFRTDLWLSRYNKQPEPLPASWNTWKIWQHTNKGTVDGVKGDCPLDNFNGTLEELEKYFNM